MDRDLPTNHPATAPPAATPSGKDEVRPPVIRVEKPEIAEEEMGGEAPCQLHNVWDVDAEE